MVVEPKISQKNLDMVQKIIDHVYEGETIPISRKLKKLLKREAKKNKKNNLNKLPPEGGQGGHY